MLICNKLLGKIDYMFYIIENHNFKDTVLSILQLFFYGKQIKLIDNINNISKDEDNIVFKSYIKEESCICEVYKKGSKAFSSQEKLTSDETEEIKRIIKLTVYTCAVNLTNLNMPWGLLTGIRPAKKITEMHKEGLNEQNIKNILKIKYLVTEEKVNLALNISKIEQKIIKNNHKNKISIYIGIPFCPTRCIYCSFTSYSIAKYMHKIDDYINALEKEISALKDYLNIFEIETIYIGGGTPSSLDDYSLERFLSIVQNNIKKPTLEYSFEAGRADTITKDKLKILKKYEISRLSINPQTLNDKTLKLINRNHLTKDFFKSFHLARELGFNNINTDIILGLLDETENDVLYTLKKLSDLKPESLTMHTLAIKRASNLKENIKNFAFANFYTIKNMIDYVNEYTKNMGLIPYYMYRQKNMIGSFENVGFCKPFYECIYNIQIMEEKQTIIAFGAYASSKFYFEDENRIERVFNVKNIDEYINRIDEMIERKLHMLKLYKEG